MKRRLLRLYSALYERYGLQGWWPARSAFEIAVGAMLTQHTAWPGAARGIANLRSTRRLEPRRVAALSPPAIGRLIRPAGTWRLKARSLLALTTFLLARAGAWSGSAKAPLAPLRHDLLAVPGIGPETADAILLYAVGHPVYVADAST